MYVRVYIGVFASLCVSVTTRVSVCTHRTSGSSSEVGYQSKSSILSITNVFSSHSQHSDIVFGKEMKRINRNNWRFVQYPLPNSSNLQVQCWLITSLYAWKTTEKCRDFRRLNIDPTGASKSYEYEPILNFHFNNNQNEKLVQIC